VMTAAAAEITRPAGAAGFLAVDMPRGQPIGLTGNIDAVVERTHRAFLVADKTVAGRKFAFGGDAEIAGAGAAGVGAVGAAMDFAHGVGHVGERIAPAAPRSALIFPPAIDHFAQHQLDELDPEDSPYDHVRRLMPDAPEAKVRARVGAIGFSGLAANNAVKTLSGGEKSRLLLGLATFVAPHLVILDEPTNHLDIDSRAALIEAINDYPGAVILVSHDRYLLEACADRLWLVQGGKVAPFDGDLDDYRRAVLTDNNEDNSAASKGPARPDPAEVRRAAADRRAETAPLRKRITQAETEIANLTRQLRKLDGTLADGDVFARDPARAAELAKTRANVVAAIAKAEEEWIAASAALETA